MKRASRLKCVCVCVCGRKRSARVCAQNEATTMLTRSVAYSWPALLGPQLAGVHKWVREVMIESGCKEITIDFKPIRRGSALGGAAEASHHKKQRHLKEEIERLVSRARENECSNLNVCASGIRSARSSANAWLNDAGTSTSAFERALGEASQAKASEESVLKSLRDLCDLYAPMHLLDSTGACVVISALERNHSSRAVKNLCSQVREIWRLQLEKSLIVGAAPWDDYPILCRTNLKPVKSISKSTKSGIGKTGVGGKGGSGKTGIGKGRKICHHCNQIVGSPSRVCPFCKGELPLKANPKAA